MASKILIIDDDPNYLEILSMRLSSNGYDVVMALSGQEGMEKAVEVLPDLIISDIKMKNMDGYTLLRLLKQNDKTKPIPVIMLTGYREMKDLFALENVDDYIVKPFDHKDLLARIKMILDGKVKL